MDADPTFEDYREDFKYCRDIPGLIEAHIELTPFCNDVAGWDEDYWIGLKKDLLKNFSMKRFQHMQKVAEVFYKEKIDKIQKERETKERQERELEEARRKLELENQRIERCRRQEEQHRNFEREKATNGKVEPDVSGKKVLGVVLIIIIILIIIVLIIQME